MISNHALMKRINRAKVLNAVRRHAPVSRTELAALTQLDKKSITNFVSELIAESILQEGRMESRRAGRPRAMLNFVPGKMNAAGIHVDANRVTGVMIDPAGRIMAEHQIAFPSDAKLSTISNAVKQTYNTLLQSTFPLPLVGCSLPGVIDLESGIVCESVNLPVLEGGDARQFFGRATGADILLEEASRTKALAEKWFGAGREHSAFVCVDLGMGVGIGIMHARRLYHGAGTYAGELGHVMIEPKGRLCRCGNRGCLETYISESTLFEQIRKTTGTRIQSLDQADETVPAVRDIFADAGYKLGIGLSFLINLTSPSLLILNGALADRGEIVLESMRRGLIEHALRPLVDQCRIVVSTLDFAAARGAASLVLATQFEVEGHYYI